MSVRPGSDTSVVVNGYRSLFHPPSFTKRAGVLPLLKCWWNHWSGGTTRVPSFQSNCFTCCCLPSLKGVVPISRGHIMLKPLPSRRMMVEPGPWRWPREIGTTPFKDGKQQEVKLFDWKEGTLVVPPLQWFHQHFNSGKTPARFVKLGGWNNDLYPFTTTLVSDPGRTEIDYPDEDPRVRQIFAQRLTATGGQFKMPESVFKKG